MNLLELNAVGVVEKNRIQQEVILDILCKIEELLDNTREVDIKGWFKSNYIIGIIFTVTYKLVFKETTIYVKHTIPTTAVMRLSPCEHNLGPVFAFFISTLYCH